MSATATRTTNNADRQAGNDGSHTASPFFKLPIELRLAIYEEVLPTASKTDEILDETKQQPKLIDIGSEEGNPPLLQTCRAIRAEAAPFFLKNKFKVTIIDLETDACDAWFCSFKGLDVSKVKMQIIWRKSNKHSTDELVAKTLAFIKAVYHGRSHIFPESSIRQWKIATKEIVPIGGSQAPNFSPGKAVALLACLPEFPEIDAQWLLRTMRALAQKVQKSQMYGLAWHEIEDDMEAYVRDQWTGTSADRLMDLCFPIEMGGP